MRQNSSSKHHTPRALRRWGRGGTLAAAALALQCIFLHPGVAAPVDGGVDAAPIAPMAPGIDAQAALGRRLAAKVVEVVRVPSATVGPAAPVQGLWVARDRVVTAFFAVAGWPFAGQQLAVVTPAGQRLEAAVGLQDARIGLSVLDVPGLGAPPGGPVAGVPGATLGRLVYAVRPGGLRQVPITGLGEGQRAYYLKGAGAPLPLGTPVFDGAGRWVTLVGVRSDDPSVAGFMLPADAVRQLLRRALEWHP